MTLNKRFVSLRIAIAIAVNVVLVLCASVAFLSLRSYIDAQQSYSDIQTLTYEDASSAEIDYEQQPTLAIDWNALLSINPETVGWVRISDTEIDYPIVQGVADEYLYKLFDGSPSDIGSIFLDPINRPTFSDKVSFLYGHNLIDGSMFSDISKYSEQEYFGSHNDIIVATPDKELHLRPWACCVVDGMDTQLHQIGEFNNATWKLYCTEVLEEAVIRSRDASASTPPSQLVCFVTCSYQTSDSRTLLFCSEYETHTSR